MVMKNKQAFFMNIKEKIYNDIKGKEYNQDALNVPDKVRELMDFLTCNYGFYDIQYITGHVYNVFMLAMDKQKRMLFIKSGRHADFYRNEYIMGQKLWDIDHEHFLEPLYYCDKGKFFFFANEIMDGDSLQRISDSGWLHKMPAESKMSLIRDLYQIFIALKKSDVVHRDIRPENLAVLGDKLVLIDFQLAVSKSNYIELESMSVGRLRGLGTRKYRYKMWQWDDSYSLLKCLSFIGCPSSEYRKEYKKIYKEIKSYIGHDTIKSSKRESEFNRFFRHLTKKHKR